MKIITSKKYKKPKKAPYLYMYWKMIHGPEYAKNMTTESSMEVKKSQTYIDVLTNKMETLDT